MSFEVDIRQRLGSFQLDARFSAPPGLTVLFGRSGSGKSTLINAVAGLGTPQEGRIRIGSRLLFDRAAGVNLPVRKRRLGYIFQDALLFPHLNVRRNLTYGQRFAPRGHRGESLNVVADLLGIGGLLARRPAELSGGERQRVAIGRAILAAPELILADEPLSALDQARKAEILPYFERMRDELNIPILYVSHSAAEVARLATTVVALEKGRVSAVGPASEILSDPEITPVGVRSAGAMITARVACHHEDGLSELSAGGVALFLPRLKQAVGAQIRLRIAAHDVVIAAEPPVGLSTLNIIPAKVRAIKPGEGPGALVTLDTQAGRILARVTKRSVAALGLEPGRVCHAVLKSVATAPEDLSDGQISPSV